MAVGGEVAVVAVTVLAGIDTHEVSPSLVLKQALDQDLSLLLGLINELADELLLNPVEIIVLFYLFG